MATYRRHRRGVGFSSAGTFGGALAAIGMLALIAGILTAVGAAIGVHADFTDTEWRAIGWGGVAALAVALFLSFLMGGYIAGRMALGSGVRNGLLVFVTGLVVFGVAGLLTWALAGQDSIVQALRDADVPTTGSIWTDIGIGAAIAGGLAMLFGSLLGGMSGARWRPPLAAGDLTYEPDVDVRDEPTRVEHSPHEERSVEEERELARHGRG